jgi:hypothetical protein
MAVDVAFQVDRAAELSPRELELLKVLARGLEGCRLDVVDSPAVLVDRWLASIPDAASPWTDLVGPCFTTKALVRRLGISRQAISQAVAKHTLLRVVTADKVALFPAFQFDGHFGRMPGMKAVLDILAEAVDDPWTWVWWLNTPLDGRTLVEALWAGEVDAVLEEARDAVNSWRQP